MPRAANAGDEFFFAVAPGVTSFEPAFCGNALSPRDDPLLVGQFLSTLPLVDSANVEVTDVGDIIFRKGDLPAFPTEDSPVWAHRVTGTTGGRANGGAMCALMSRLGFQVELSVKNGQWRVGRGLLCNMGQSPRPEGSWWAHVPFNARGNAIRNASFRIEDDGQTLVVASGDVILWSSDPGDLVEREPAPRAETTGTRRVAERD